MKAGSFAVAVFTICLSFCFAFNAVAASDGNTSNPPGPHRPHNNDNNPTSAAVTSATIKVSTELSAGTGATVSTIGNTGAASAVIPIEVPPGRKGIQPNLALTYNSSKGNGFIGVGWDISIGEISRATKRGVDYNANDFVFSVGGSVIELVPAPSSWGNNCYEAKIEGAFTKYCRNGSSGGWDVTTKDGTVYTYGSSGASRQYVGSDVYKWCLDRVTDTNGNYMTISYYQDSGEVYLANIQYTGNAGIGPSNYVQFYYDTTGRTDKVPMYSTNHEITTAWRLKSINVVAGSNTARAYVLSYIGSGMTGRSLLSSVQQYGDDVILNGNGSIINPTQAHALPPTTLSWTSAPSLSTWDSSFPNDTVNSFTWLAGDINGDAKNDLIKISNGPDGYYANVYKANGTGYDAFWSGKISDYSTAASSEHWLAGDINGDGMTDLIYVFRDSNGNQIVRTIVADMTGGFHYIADSSNTTISGSQSDNWMTGDVYGDGKAALIGITIVNGGTVPQVYKPVQDSNNKWIYVIGPTGPFTTYYSGDTWLIGDFNGDGKSDVLALHEASGFLWSTVFFSDGTGQLNYSSNCNVYSWYWGNTSAALITADVNGDGKSDLIRISTINGTAAVYPWTGSCFFPNNSPWTTVTNIPWSAAAAGDANGDGKTDLAEWSYDNYGVPTLFSFASNGTSFVSNGGVPINPNYSYGSFLLPVDVNGQGRIAYARPYDNPNNLGTLGLSVYLGGNGESGDLLKTISRNGASTNISYAPSSAYPNTLLPFVVQTVSSISVNDGNTAVNGGNGNTSTTYYDYSGGYFDYPSREFRGFGIVRQQNPDGSQVTRGFWQDDLRKGMLYGYITEVLANHNAYEGEFYDIAGTGTPYVTQSKHYFCDGAATYNELLSQMTNGTTSQSKCKMAAVQFDHDGYGNVTGKHYLGDVLIQGDEKDEYIDYTYNHSEYSTLTSKWVLSLPYTAYTQVSGVTKAQAWFSYNTTNGNNLTKTFWLQNGTNPVTTYTYDNYGNVSSVKDANNHLATIEYYSSNNPTYTYPVKKTTVVQPNNLQLVTTTQYDERYGKPIAETDVNGNIVNYTPDNFGRTNTADNHNSGTNAYAWKETYHDGLNRVIKTRTPAPAPYGSDYVIVQQTIYDTSGHVYQTSLPYLAHVVGSTDVPQETVRWTTYYYDILGRVTYVLNPDTTHIQKIYDKGRTTTIDANNHQKIQETDVYGRLIRVEEYTGSYPYASLYATTFYGYDALNNLTDVWDAQSNNTHIGYDTLSRKTSMSDPDMGSWSYEYDAAGNLTKQTDAKSQKIWFQYDELNRIRQKDYDSQKSLGSGDVVYTYDENGVSNSKGRLTTVKDLSGTRHFFYDTLGRATTTTKTVDGTPYTIQTSYDSLGRTESITYPDNEMVYYTYDDAGNLNEVSNITPFAVYSGFNALGQAASVTYGNNVSTAYQYYSTNNRLYSITTNGSAGLQNIAYWYDNVGNIQNITDYLDSSRTQNFLYDELNRLTSAERPNLYPVETTSYTYDTIGNIINNSRLGDYTYWKQYYSTKPHAVYSAGGYAYAYDNNGNMTTRNGVSMTYDYDNRLTSMGSNAFVYDYSGERVKKNSTVYIGKLYECTSGVCTKHIFAGSNRIASKTDYHTYYYHTDHLGSSTVVTNEAGNLVQENYYYPYGEIRVRNGNVTDYKFTGQEEDEETGLFYYGARYYDPATGRFVSADSIVPSPGNPQHLNRYSYALNNPLIYIDPSGHSSFLKSFITGLVGGASFILTGGATAFLAGDIAQFIGASMVAGAASGATNGLLSGGGIPGMFQGAMMGVPAGFAGAGLAEVGPWLALGAGAGYSYAQGGVNGLGNFGIGILGGIVGAGGVQYAKNNWSKWFPTKEYINISSLDGQMLVARWQMSQSTGEVFYVDNATEEVYLQGAGYSGHGEGLNNPEMQDVPNVGPIPEGDYTIGPERTNVTGNGTVLRNSMRLTPFPENEMFDRAGFLMHGGNMELMNSSRGCPVLPLDLRNIIGGSGDNVLRVTP